MFVAGGILSCVMIDGYEHGWRFVMYRRLNTASYVLNEVIFPLVRKNL